MPNGSGDKLAPVIRPKLAGHTVYEEPVAQRINAVARVELSFDIDRQTLPRELVETVQLQKGLGVIGPTMDAVEATSTSCSDTAKSR